MKIIQTPCEKCALLSELYSQAPSTPRNYWLWTELFTMLHDGKDYCESAYEKPTGLERALRVTDDAIKGLKRRRDWKRGNSA